MILPWMPNVDGSVLPGQPMQLFADGKFNPVPLLFGTVGPRC